MKIIKKYSLNILFLIATIGVLQGQDDFASVDNTAEGEILLHDVEEGNRLKVNFSGTLVSRFIWRGLELGDHPHIQPEVTFSVGDFFFGAWASHGIAPVAFDASIAGYKEVIPYIGYAFSLGESSDLSILLLDHYNPNFGEIGKWKDNGNGSNTLEVRAIYKAGNFDFLGSVNIYNDTDNSTYVEIGYTATLPNNFTVRPLISFTPTKSPFNGTNDFAFTQVGIITSKNIRISEDVMLPVKVDFIINPEYDKFYTAFGVGIKF